VFASLVPFLEIHQQHLLNKATCCRDLHQRYSVAAILVNLFEGRKTQDIWSFDGLFPVTYYTDVIVLELHHHVVVETRAYICGEHKDLAPENVGASSAAHMTGAPDMGASLIVLPRQPELQHKLMRTCPSRIIYSSHVSIMQTAKRNLLRNSFGDPSWQEI
ncbi:hypothetical protein ACJX0J_038024, partial [Zea mays]